MCSGSGTLHKPVAAFERRHLSVEPTSSGYMAAKIQPSVLTLNFRQTGNSGWIDLSQSASIVNRRFYRQGLNWAIAGITIQDRSTTPVSGTNNSIRTEILPTNWCVSNAWEKSMRLWLKQQNDALRESGQESIAAKFRDFKIFMDTAHYDDFVSNGYNLNATNLLPRNAVGTFLPGEWQPSQIVIPNSDTDASGSEVDPTEHYLHMVGTVGVGTAAAGSAGMLAGYAFSRSVPQSPDPVVDPRVNSTIGTEDEYNWMRNMFDVGNEDQEVLENASQRNNDLPYDQLEYPNTGLNPTSGGLQLHNEQFLTVNSLANRVSVPPTSVPCGLLKITKGSDIGDLDIQIHLVPGHARGYMTQPMTDM